MIVNFRMLPPPVEFMDIDEYMNWFRTGPARLFANVYEGTNEVLESMKIENLFSDMDEGGVDKAVLQGQWIVGDYRRQNDAVYRLVNQYPERFLAGYMCLNAYEVDDMPKVVQREITERGFRGVNIQPFFNHMRANDRRLYPVYARCQDLGVPVVLHSSINFMVGLPLDDSRPIYIDQVACDFPELKIVAAHAGWPWVLELIAIAWKHPNVYIETGAVSPKYMTSPGSGWEPLLNYGNSVLADKVLIGSNNSLPIQRIVREVKGLPLKETTKAKWLGENALRLLGMDGPQK